MTLIRKSWIYHVKFDISTDDLFKELGVSAISLTNTPITFSNAPNSNKYTDTGASHGKMFNVEFLGTLELVDSWKPLTDVTGTKPLGVAGAITNQSFLIYAHTNDLELFNGIKLSGALAAEVTRNKVEIAIAG